MTTLNTMFKQKSNTMFNKSVFFNANVGFMHETMTRLYDYIAKNRNVYGQTSVAKLMDELPQTLNNWEARGISKQGLIKAQEKFGCNMQWIKSGIGADSIGGLNTIKQDSSIVVAGVKINTMEENLLALYSKLSGKSQNAIDLMVNHLYTLEHPNDLKANPTNGKKKKETV